MFAPRESYRLSVNMQIPFIYSSELAAMNMKVQK